MQRMYLITLLFILSGLTLACNEESNPSSITDGDGEWLIPQNQVVDGGPGKDGIPALSNPDFVGVGEAGYLDDEDLVILHKNGSEVRVYPHGILDWHEIINDDFNGEKLTVSYCPLTGSAVGYGRVLNKNGQQNTTTFGVSGLLYNNNLILYDRWTDSFWSQMKLECVHGPLVGQKGRFKHLVETRFGTLKKLYPQAQVVSSQTGIYGPNQYRIYPYGDYKQNHDRLLFPISHDDQRLPRKERVLGVIEESVKAYTFDHVGQDLTVINDTFGGKPIVVVGSQSLDLLLAYYRQDAGNHTFEFQASEQALPAVMKDNKGNVYNLFGEVIDGPDMGFRLEATRSFIAFWFAWGAFYPNISIYQPDGS